MGGSDDVIEFRHFACLAKMRAKPALRGKKIRCPKCGGSVKVPGVSIEEEEAALVEAEELRAYAEASRQAAMDASPSCPRCPCDYMEPGSRKEVDAGRAVLAGFIALIFGSLAWCVLSVTFAAFGLGPLGGMVALLLIALALVGLSRRTVFLWICPQCGTFTERASFPARHVPVQPRLSAETGPPPLPYEEAPPGRIDMR